MDYKKALTGMQNPVSKPDSAQNQNPTFKELLLQLQKKYPPKSAQELEEELQEAERLYSQMDELKRKITEMTEEIQKLEQSRLQLRRDGNALSLRAHLEKGYNPEKLSTAVHDVLVGFWDTPDYEQAITLYEQIIIHYPQKRNQACFYLALIYLKGKIDNQNRGKENRRQNLSNPEKAEFYAQIIEDPKLLKLFREKSKKYLAKRK
jgi:TPR repeat protein